MTRFDSDAQKSFAQIRDGIDRTIMQHCWSQVTVCPRCGCEAEILYGDATHDASTFVEIPDCDLCNAILQEIAGDIEPTN